MTLQQLSEAGRALSVKERLQLIDSLWDSLGPDQQERPFAIDAELEKELTRRLEALESGSSPGRPWSDVRDELSARSSCSS